jgi:hypothetical protein
VKLNLNLNIGNGYLDGDATTTDSMSYKINIQQGWPDTTIIVPSDLNLNAGQTSISFYTPEPGNQILLRTNVKNEDTDMIRLFTSLETLVQLTKRLPTAMDIQNQSATQAAGQGQEDPVAILKLRLAKGEITPEQYEESLKVLEEAG